MIDNAVYYGQTDLVCLMLLIVVYTRLKNRSETLSAQRRTFLALIWCAMILCVSDLTAGILNGKQFTGNRFINEFANIIYFCSISITSFCWLVYVKQRLSSLEFNFRAFIWLSSIPLILIIAVILLNPIIHFMYTIDEQNIYVRGPGVPFHWLVSWGYLAAAEIMVFTRIRSTERKTTRRKLMRLLWFPVAPAAAAISQMLVYGLTTMQCGITFSIILMTYGILQEKISLDSLTGLNNRSALENYLSSPQTKFRNTLSVIMCDVDHFKGINDTLGHLVGDLALKSVADILKSACNKNPASIFLCRFGGDEFVLCGQDINDTHYRQLLSDIEDGLKNFNEGSHNIFTLELSIGKSTGVCHNYDDAEKLIQEADKSMYSNKESKVAQRK